LAHIRDIGSGSFGTVELARVVSAGHPLDGQEVALKLIKVETREQVVAAWREYRMLRMVGGYGGAGCNPHIVCVFELAAVVANRDDIQLAILMEVAQMDVNQYARRYFGLPTYRETVFRWFVQSLRALLEIHSRGIIHGDIKTRNMLLDDRWVLKLADFGGACIAVEPQTRCDPTVRTPAYTSPERLLRLVSDAGPLCDIYSLGVSFFELFQGRKWIDPEVMTRHVASLVRAKYALPAVAALRTWYWHNYLDNWKCAKASRFPAIPGLERVLRAMTHPVPEERFLRDPETRDQRPVSAWRALAALGLRPSMMLGRYTGQHVRWPTMDQLRGLREGGPDAGVRSVKRNRQRDDEEDEWRPRKR
jgi:serine/threonine protein kinase